MVARFELNADCSNFSKRTRLIHSEYGKSARYLQPALQVLQLGSSSNAANNSRGLRGRSCDFSCGWRFGSRRHSGTAAEWRIAAHTEVNVSAVDAMSAARLPSPTCGHSAAGSPTPARSDRRQRSRSDIGRRPAPKMLYGILSTSILGPDAERHGECREPATQLRSRTARALRSTRFRRLI